MVKSILYSVIISQILCGCFATKIIVKLLEKKVPPKIVVLPILCENSETGEKITKGLVENIDKKVEALDQKNFKLFLASYSIHIEEYLPAEISTSPFEVPVGTLTQISPTLKYFSKELFEKAEIRGRFYLESGINYLVVGQAKEQKWGPLEIENIKTAEKAEFKLLELKSGRILLEENFKQGSFEIVAPERIGSKFASKINKKLKQIRKQARKIEKASRKTVGDR